MAFVVTENCIRCKYSDCVAVCPVEAFHEGPNFLAINPDVCIDCDLCAAECPANAIFQEDQLPAGMEVYRELNREFVQDWPVITAVIPPPSDADEWNGVTNKLPLLER
ncbi:MAG: ferredoxin FdxA [Shewanella sp.]